LGHASKTLDAMRGNPANDWTIDDVARLCRAYGLECAAPKRGSHFVIKARDVNGHLTIPARRPVKAVYIKLLVEYVELAQAGGRR
jgi:hypothetical protein